MPATAYRLGAAASAISGAWSNASNILAESDTVADFTTTTKNDVRVLEAQNFGFDALLPSACTINSVDLKARASCTSGGTLRCYLRRSTTDGTAHDSTDTALTTREYTAETRPGGGSWARADLLDGTLTVRVEGRQPNNTTSRTYSWAWVEVRVTYTDVFDASKTPVTVSAVVAVPLAPLSAASQVTPSPYRAA